MTDSRNGHRFSALWVLAPVTAAVFGVSADWAIQHNPLASAEASAPSAPAPTTSRTSALEARLQGVTTRYEARRQALLDVERSLRRGAAQVAALREEGQGSSGTTGDVAPSVSAPAAPPAAAVPSAAPSAPAAPPVDTTTGAS